MRCEELGIATRRVPRAGARSHAVDRRRAGARRCVGTPARPGADAHVSEPATSGACRTPTTTMRRPTSSSGAAAASSSSATPVRPLCCFRERSRSSPRRPPSARRWAGRSTPWAASSEAAETFAAVTVEGTGQRLRALRTRRGRCWPPVARPKRSRQAAWPSRCVPATPTTRGSVRRAWTPLERAASRHSGRRDRPCRDARRPPIPVSMARRIDDALLDRRVGVEQAGRLLELLRGSRIGDVEMRRGAVDARQRPGVGGDLLERRRESGRVARQLDARGVGEKLAPSRDGELDHHRRERARGSRARSRDQQEHEPMPPPPPSRRPAEEAQRGGRSRRPGRSCRRRRRPVSRSGCRSCARARARGRSTPWSSSRFIASSSPRGDRDDRVRGVTAGREGVRGRIVDDVDARQRQARRRCVSSSTTLNSCGCVSWMTGVRAADRKHDRVARVVGDQAPGDQRRRRRSRERRDRRRPTPK